ncbi:unnamed protein product, partial [Rotaria magnacalcarata]
LTPRVPNNHNANGPLTVAEAKRLKCLKIVGIIVAVEKTVSDDSSPEDDDDEIKRLIRIGYHGPVQPNEVEITLRNLPGRTSTVVYDRIRRNTAKYMAQYYDRISPCHIRRNTII